MKLKNFLPVTIITTLSIVALNAVAVELIIPDLPPLSSSSYILVDYHTGTVISEKDADKPFEPASLTKLMTAYMVYEAIEDGLINLNTEVKIGENARQAEGSRMFVEQGTSVLVEDLLKGMVIQSGNDASIALAEAIAEEEKYFTDMMNKKAAVMGMKNSHFMNATGLPEEGHHMSARDIALVSQYIIHDYPTHYETYSEKEYTYNGINQHNRNSLLWRNEYVDGLKTGHTESANFCLTISAERDGMRLIAVVLDAPSKRSRFNDAERLLNYGFRFYKTHRLYKEGEKLHEVRIWGGEKEYVVLGPAKDFYITVPRGAKGNLQIEKIIKEDINAPVEEGQKLGIMKISLDKDHHYTIPLIAFESIAQGSIFKRTIDKFIRLF